MNSCGTQSPRRGRRHHESHPCIWRCCYIARGVLWPQSFVQSHCWRCTDCCVRLQQVLPRTSEPSQSLQVVIAYRDVQSAASHLERKLKSKAEFALQTALRPADVPVAVTAIWQCLVCQNYWAAWFDVYFYLEALSRTRAVAVRFPCVARGTYLQNVTVEGENYMIAQQTTRGLLKLASSPTSSAFQNAWEGWCLKIIQHIFIFENRVIEKTEANTQPTCTRRPSDLHGAKRRHPSNSCQWNCSANLGQI